MLIEVLDSMIIGGEPRQVGEVVEVDDEFGKYQISKGWARISEPKPQPEPVQGSRRSSGRRSNPESTEET